MNSAMFFVAALALCALPSALGQGLMCYKCTPNITAGALCNNMTEYTTENCADANSTCATVTVNLVAYVLGCSTNQTCTDTNTTVCDGIIMEAKATGQIITSCTTECCSTEKCNKAPTASTMPPSATAASGATDADKPTTAAVGDIFRPAPQLIGSLFIVLAAFYFGMQ